jgi:hypothetical protein
MKIERKLDACLRYYQRNKKHNDSEWQELYSKIGEDDFRAVIDKIRKDGYIIDKTLEDGKTITFVTIEGKLFLRTGGYFGRLCWFAIKFFCTTLSSLILLAATVAVPILMIRLNELRDKEQLQKLKEEILIEMQKEQGSK